MSARRESDRYWDGLIGGLSLGVSAWAVRTMIDRGDWWAALAWLGFILFLLAVNVVRIRKLSKQAREELEARWARQDERALRKHRKIGL